MMKIPRKHSSNLFVRGENSQNQVLTSNYKSNFIVSDNNLMGNFTNTKNKGMEVLV